MTDKILTVGLESMVSDELVHVGGINEGLGGVDPFIDEKLMRLCGFSC